MRTMRIAWVSLAFFLAVGAAGQDAVALERDQRRVNCDSQVRSTYLLGPDDEVEISDLELDEQATKPMRIDDDGNIQAPLVGRVHLAGLTVQQSEEELNKRLTTYIRHPQIDINVKELRSQPVSVLGAVNTPGVHQVQGHETLLEMLSLAGGLRPDAGYSVRITRQLEWGCISLPNARFDASNMFTVAEVNLKEIMEAKNPAENFVILPHDVISVPKAEMIYVIGDVRRSGGFAIGEHKSIPVLQALSLAEGLNGTADTRHARILRVNGDSDQRAEIAVDVKRILTGKGEDVLLQGDDILFIPGSLGKKTTVRAIEAAIQAGTGLIIWRAP
jgi:polysaccharide export outer membrane protein